VTKLRFATCLQRGHNHIQQNDFSKRQKFMSLLRQIRTDISHLPAPKLLRYLLKDIFPGKAVVTASLRAPSIVVLKMIADVDPATPVLFCQRGHVYPESVAYREEIIDILGLTNVTVTAGGTSSSGPCGFFQNEQMWVGTSVGDGRVRETVHLAEALVPYDCWISAVYHAPKPENITHRVDICGEKLRVDVLRHRSANDIRRFMRDHDLPFHPRAKPQRIARPTSQDAVADIYHF